MESLPGACCSAGRLSTCCVADYHIPVQEGLVTCRNVCTVNTPRETWRHHTYLHLTNGLPVLGRSPNSKAPVRERVSAVRVIAAENGEVWQQEAFVNARQHTSLVTEMVFRAFQL